MLFESNSAKLAVHSMHCGGNSTSECRNDFARNSGSTDGRPKCLAAASVGVSFPDLDVLLYKFAFLSDK